MVIGKLKQGDAQYSKLTPAIQCLCVVHGHNSVYLSVSLYLFLSVSLSVTSSGFRTAVWASEVALLLSPGMGLAPPAYG